jgi:hypothetical protein
MAPVQGSLSCPKLIEKYALDLYSSNLKRRLMRNAVHALRGDRLQSGFLKNRRNAIGLKTLRYADHRYPFRCIEPECDFSLQRLRVETIQTVTDIREDLIPIISTGCLVEIACDESGLEGENLVSGNTDVFAHASVRIDIEEAAGWVQEIRHRIRSPAREYHANHLLREKHRPVLEWFLSPLGPIYGNAHVHLIDKAFFVVSRLIDVLIGEIPGAEGADGNRDQHTRDMTVMLYREGQRAFGIESWRSFLESSNSLMRARNRSSQTESPVDSFFCQVDELRPGRNAGQIDNVMEAIRQARPRADEYRARLLNESTLIPPLDPLIPAIVRAVDYWSDGGTPVLIVHDEHNSLTNERIEHVMAVFGTPGQAPFPCSSSARLAGLRLVDSRSDARVQLADFLAGVARKISSDELNKRGDTELTALLRPYVDASSIWGDDRSWSLLGGQSSSQA